MINPKQPLQKEANTKVPGVKLVVIFAIATLGLTMAGSLWLYLSAVSSLRAQAKDNGVRLYVEGFAASHSATNTPKSASAEVPDPEKSAPTLLAQMEDWALKLVVASAAGSAAVVLVMLVAITIWRQRISRQMTKAAQVPLSDTTRLHETSLELERVNLEVERQKTLCHNLQEQLQSAQAEVDKRVEERTAHLTAMFTQLEDELNDRKQMERALAQQAQELGRSKDVLEMHVQARTQELQKLQRRYEHILNSAGEGIYGLDLQGKTTFVNPAAAKLTGWKVEELIGKMEKEIFLGGKTGTQTTILAGNTENPGEAVFFRKDGTTFFVEAVRTPIMDRDKSVGAVVIFKDITDRKRTDDALARKADELARSNAELEQFAYVASHDLQEPLRKIQAFGDRLKSKVDAVQLQDGRDYLERMQNAAARMQRLINDLLTFSRVISATQPFVPVDLAVVTKEVLTDLEVRIEQTKGKVEIGQLPTLEADPLQMRQLLQNLIGNALKFQAPGAQPLVKIKARLIQSPLATEADPRPEDESCELTIQDNGIGFDEKYSDKIFAMFQRLHGRNEYEGTGVGLAVCRRITDRHGGTIRAQSKPGEGATFVVTLPVHHQVKPADETNKSGEKQ